MWQEEMFYAVDVIAKKKRMKDMENRYQSPERNNDGMKLSKRRQKQSEICLIKGISTRNQWGVHIGFVY